VKTTLQDKKSNEFVLIHRKNVVKIPSKGQAGLKKGKKGLHETLKNKVEKNRN